MTRRFDQTAARPHAIRGLLIGVWALGLCGCSVADPLADAFTVRDSAGVRIMESAGPVWAEGGQWALTSEPVLTIGVAEGAPELEFQTILGLTRLANGNIVVGNRGTRELRFFAPDGRFLRAAGRDGEGPGEFRTFNGVYRYRADSLIVWDYRLHRWSVLDTTGEFARLFAPSRPGMNPRSLAPLRDGSLIIADRWIESRELRSVDHQRLFRFSPEGVLLDSLGSYRAGESFRPSNGASISMERIFGPELVHAAFDDGYHLGMAEEYEVLSFDAEGTLLRRVRWAGPDRAVSEADVDAFRARFRERETTSELAMQFARFVVEVPAADRFPAYNALEVDAAGNLWLAEYARPRAEGPRAWTVLDAEGRWLGEVEMPRDLEVWEIGEDYVLGVARDELGVVRVRMYGLAKPDL